MATETTHPLPDPLTPDDVKTIVLSLGWSRGDKGFSEDEALTVLTEIRAILLMAELYKLALGGDLFLDVKDGNTTVNSATPAEVAAFKHSRARALAGEAFPDN